MLIDSHESAHFVHTNQCDDCKHTSTLVARYHSQEQDDVRCGRCGGEHFHNPPSITSLWWKRPDSVPVATANRLADKHRDKIEAIAAGLTPDLADKVRQRYGLLPTKGS
ncbi:MAG: hypothetical protein V2A73_08730 [Pseudomonadota bacterium]